MGGLEEVGCVRGEVRGRRKGKDKEEGRRMEGGWVRGELRKEEIGGKREGRLS